MKKRLLIGLLVLTFLGASPYLAGWVVHYQLSTFFNNLSLPHGISVDIEPYSVRYARSWVRLKVVADDPIMTEPHTSYIRLKIFHGPSSRLRMAACLSASPAQYSSQKRMISPRTMHSCKIPSKTSLKRMKSSPATSTLACWAIST